MERSNLDVFKSAASTFLAIASITLTLHYFFSFCFWIKTIEKYGLSTFSVFSWEDILFPAAGLNLLLFSFAFLCVVSVAILVYSLCPKISKTSAINKEYIMFILIFLYAFIVACAYKYIFEIKNDPKLEPAVLILLNNGTEIQTGNNCHLIFYGAKYIILSDSLNNAYLIPVSSVREVGIHR